MAQPPLLEKAPSGLIGEPFLPIPACNAIPARTGSPLAPAVDFTPAQVGHYPLPGDREWAPLDHRMGLI
jgi:hypothetical protein